MNDDANKFRELLHTIFELYLPNNNDSIKIGNVTFTNQDGFVLHDTPHSRWDTQAIANDVMTIVEKHVK